LVDHEAVVALAIVSLILQERDRQCGRELLGWIASRLNALDGPQGS
jgi:hypothetical protein